MRQLLYFVITIRVKKKVSLVNRSSAQDLVLGDWVDGSDFNKNGEYILKRLG
jgi:hypothetical protein